MIETVETHGGGPADEVSVSLVDCDVHPTFPAHWSQSLYPYFSAEWRHRFGARPYVGGDAGQRAGLSYVLPFNGFYPIPQSPIQMHLIREGEGPPASDPAITGRDLFDTMGVSRAILQSPLGGAISSMPTPDP